MPPVQRIEIRGSGEDSLASVNMHPARMGGTLETRGNLHSSAMHLQWDKYEGSLLT